VRRARGDAGGDDCGGASSDGNCEGNDDSDISDGDYGGGSHDDGDGDGGYDSDYDDNEAGRCITKPLIILSLVVMMVMTVIMVIVLSMRSHPCASPCPSPPFVLCSRRSAQAEGQNLP
jgi:hypothetical protein